MSSPHPKPFTSILTEAPDTRAPGYIKVKRSEIESRDKMQIAMEEAKTQGFQSGYDDGYQSGVERGKKEAHEQAIAEFRDERKAQIAEFVASLEHASQSLDKAVQVWLHDAEERLEELAIHIAETILHSQLTLDRTSTSAILKACLAEVRQATEVRVRVNPIDTPMMEQYRAEILATSPTVRSLEIVGDPSIEGGCVVETVSGEIDGTTQTQLRLVRAELSNAA